jgi:hypothetical protein
MQGLLLKASTTSSHLLRALIFYIYISLLGSMTEDEKKRNPSRASLYWCCGFLVWI